MKKRDTSWLLTIEGVLGKERSTLLTTPDVLSRMIDSNQHIETLIFLREKPLNLEEKPME
jgi:hypothetical protein